MQNGIYRGRWLSSGALVLLQLSGCNTKKRQMVVSPPFCWSEPPYRCNVHLQGQMPAPYPTPFCAIYAFPWPRVSCSGCPTQHLLCKPMQLTTSSVACLGCLMHCAGVDTTRRHHRSPLTTQTHNSQLNLAANHTKLRVLYFPVLKWQCHVRARSCHEQKSWSAGRLMQQTWSELAVLVICFYCALAALACPLVHGLNSNRHSVE